MTKNMRSFKGWTWLLLLRPPPPTLHICQGGDGNVSIFGSFCKPSRTCRIRGVAAAGVKDAGDGYSVDVLGRYRAWQGLFLRVWLNVIPPPPILHQPHYPPKCHSRLAPRTFSHPLSLTFTRTWSHSISLTPFAFPPSTLATLRNPPLLCFRLASGLEEHWQNYHAWYAPLAVHSTCWSAYKSSCRSTRFTMNSKRKIPGS